MFLDLLRIQCFACMLCVICLCQLQHTNSGHIKFSLILSDPPCPPSALIQDVRGAYCVRPPLTWHLLLSNLLLHCPLIISSLHISQLEVSYPIHSWSICTCFKTHDSQAYLALSRPFVVLKPWLDSWNKIGNIQMFAEGGKKGTEQLPTCHNSFHSSCD